MWISTVHRYCGAFNMNRICWYNVISLDIWYGTAFHVISMCEKARRYSISIVVLVEQAPLGWMSFNHTVCHYVPLSRIQVVTLTLIQQRNRLWCTIVYTQMQQHNQIDVLKLFFSRVNSLASLLLCISLVYSFFRSMENSIDKVSFWMNENVPSLQLFLRHCLHRQNKKSKIFEVLLFIFCLLLRKSIFFVVVTGPVYRPPYNPSRVNSEHLILNSAMNYKMQAI